MELMCLTLVVGIGLAAWFGSRDPFLPKPEMTKQELNRGCVNSFVALVICLILLALLGTYVSTL